MAEISFRVLGPVEVTLDGERLRLGATKQRAVLAMLALSANHVVSADRLMEGLWGEELPPSAAKNLQLYVSQLRKLFAEADGVQIVTHGRGYELRVARESVDAFRAERLLGEASATATAAALFRGPALADLADEPFAAAAIRPLEELRLRAQVAALEAEVADGGHHAALPKIEALLAEQPLSEGLHELRMLALYRAGRQADALEAFRHARARLVEEIGVEPGPALRELHEAVLRQDSGLNAPHLPSGTLTLLFTDIEGSTRLVSELGPGYPQLLAEHQRKVRAAAVARGGVEVNTQGDAFFFVFADAMEACAAADDVHASIGDGPIHVRIGIHTGEPERIGDDYTGIDVHRAARICAAGRGGQTVLSERTRVVLPRAVTVRDLGLHRLKDLGDPEKLFQLGDATFPPLRSLNATNLPAQPSPLVGREVEIERVAQLVRERRLVTLTGPGGAGKTRLGLQVAGELAQEFPDGVYWTPLAAVRDPSLVLPTIAEALGAQGPPGEHIGERRMLILLDNLEQVIDCGADLAELLAACPGLTLLVTTRTLLHINGECVYEVTPLLDAEAVELFRQRAVSAEPIEVVHEICRRLDRLPLAIELAAARTRILPPVELLARLERALDILTSGAREAPTRQRTLRGAIEWSHGLLADDERVAFRRLAVFAGGFDLEAAEAVCRADLDLLESLLDQSMVRRTQAGRLFMLETIHEYAAELLEQSDEMQDLRQAHAAHFLAMAETASPSLYGGGTGESIRRLGDDEDNIRAALEWAIAHQDTDVAFRLCSALARYWEVKGRLDEGSRWHQRALALPATGDARQRARALRSAGLMEMHSNRNATALELQRASLELARELGDAGELADSLREWVRCAALETKDPPGWRLALDESLELSRLAGDRDGEAWSLHLLGDILRDAGDHEAGEEAFARSLVISRERGNSHLANMTGHSLGDLALDRGDLQRARTLYRDALRGAVDDRLARLTLYCVAGLSAVAALQGDARPAAQLWQAAQAAERALGYRMLIDERARYERALEGVGSIDEPPLDLDAAAAIALDELPDAGLTESDG